MVSWTQLKPGTEPKNSYRDAVAFAPWSMVEDKPSKSALVVASEKRLVKEDGDLGKYVHFVIDCPGVSWSFKVDRKAAKCKACNFYIY